MTKHLKAALAAVALAGIASAYGTCYLLEVDVCILEGQSLTGTFSYPCGGSTTPISSSIFADENAYYWGRHSVTSGGKNLSPATSYCNIDSSNPGTAGGFQIHFVNPCTGVPGQIDLSYFGNVSPYYSINSFSVSSSCN